MHLADSSDTWAPLARSLVASLAGSRSGLPSRLRSTLADYGLGRTPFGDGDAKTASPGTYREVGGTCPSTCPYLGNGCYAQGGNVGINAKRSALADYRDSTGAAMAAIAWGVATGRVARLHVSGDLGSDRASVDAYAGALVSGLRSLRSALVDAGYQPGQTMAWSYTHVNMGVVGRWLGPLRNAGLSVRRSDYHGPGGAIVYPHVDVPALRRTEGNRYAKCPAQLGDTDCNACRLCWTRPDLTIVFDPHGSGSRAVTRTVKENA